MFQSFPLIVLSVLIALATWNLATAQKPAVVNSDIIAFDFEGESSLSSSLIFPQGKTDYFWGHLEVNGKHFHWWRYYIDPVPGEQQQYTFTVYEKIDMDGGQLSSQGKIQFQFPERTGSVTMVRQVVLDTVDPEKLKREFMYEKGDIESLRDESMRSYSFLGVFLGPQRGWDVEPDQRGYGFLSRVNSTYGYETTFQFRHDGLTNFVMECDIQQFEEPLERYEASQTFPPNDFRSSPGYPKRPRTLGGEGEYRFEMTSESSGTETRPFAYRTTERETIHRRDLQVTNLTNSVSWPFTMKYPPNNGIEVVLMDEQQIDAQWQDGKIVRVFDGGIAEELASARFRSPSSRIGRWLPFIGIAIVSLGIWIKRQRAVK